jgi:phage terminase large subunit-like protein
MRLGRQELEGELLEDVEGALWKRAWIDDPRVSEVPPAGFRTVVVGLDPADGTADGAEQALVVAGLASTGSSTSCTQRACATRRCSG